MTCQTCEIAAQPSTPNAFDFTCEQCQIRYLRDVLNAEIVRLSAHYGADVERLQASFYVASGKPDSLNPTSQYKSERNEQ